MEPERGQQEEPLQSGLDLQWWPRRPVNKVIIMKSRGESSLIEQDTIENDSLPINFLKKSFFLVFFKKTYFFNVILCNFWAQHCNVFLFLPMKT